MIIVLAILLFGLLIFVHELGHFMFGKLFGVTVHEFAIGMGPAILKKQKGETLYALRAFPIGGFVRLEGEDEESSEPGAFNKKPAWQRLIILAAGGIMNILAGFLIYVILLCSASGVYVPKVSSIEPNSPAALAGICPGDVICEIDGRASHLQNDVSFTLLRNGDEPTTVKVMRNGEKLLLNITPEYNEEQGRYMVGYTASKLDMNIPRAIKYGFYSTMFAGRIVYTSLGELIRGRVSLSDMSGPVGIVSTIDKTAKQSSAPIQSVLNLIAVIAVNLGIMNLLPLPALDGGRMLFIIIEIIRRKPVKPEREGIVHLIGMVLLLALMVVITFSDILRL